MSKDKAYQTQRGVIWAKCFGCLDCTNIIRTTLVARVFKSILNGLGIAAEKRGLEF
jgi:hypothetical protein